MSIKCQFHNMLYRVNSNFWSTVSQFLLRYTRTDAAKTTPALLAWLAPSMQIDNTKSRRNIQCQQHNSHLDINISRHSITVNTNALTCM